MAKLRRSSRAQCIMQRVGDQFSLDLAAPSTPNRSLRILPPRPATIDILRPPCASDRIEASREGAWPAGRLHDPGHTVLG